MKRFVITLSVLLIVLTSFLTFPSLKSGIRGMIDPADGAKKVWAISGTDSISTVPMMGKFSIDLRAGNWKLFVEAVQPAHNTTVESLLVVDGEYTDAGMIKLP